VTSLILAVQHGLFLQGEEAALTGGPTDLVKAQMSIIHDLCKRISALPIIPPDNHAFKASVYAVTDHGATPTYLGTITTNAPDATEATIQARTILWLPSPRWCPPPHLRYPISDEQENSHAP
jgi:hypothetical protein